MVVNQAAARWAGRRLGTVVTVRDHTELRALVSELKTIRGFAEALSAQAHESANQLHTVISLIELGRPEQALAFATTELAVAQQLTDLVVDGVPSPRWPHWCWARRPRPGSAGVDLLVAEDVDLPAGVADPRDLVTIVGNLLDNAIDAAVDGAEPRWVRFDARTGPPDHTELQLLVADSGPGLHPDQAQRVFERGYTTKPTDRVLGRGIGLALVAQAAHRYGGSVEVSTETGAVFTVRCARSPSRCAPRWHARATPDPGAGTRSR